MNKNTGYRQMLRDRCPKVVNFALKWCKAKEKWLDYVYKEQIWILKSKKERLAQTKAILGITADGHKFNFHDTIFWKGLMPDEVLYWKYVEEWVNFFMQNYMCIEEAYRISSEVGRSIEQRKLEIMNNWLIDLCPTDSDSPEEVIRKTQYVNDLADFLIDCCEGEQ